MRQDKDKKERVAMRGYCSPRVPRFAQKRVSLLFFVLVFGAFAGAHGRIRVQLTAQSDAVADVHSRGMKDGVSRVAEEMQARSVLLLRTRIKIT